MVPKKPSLSNLFIIKFLRICIMDEEEEEIPVPLNNELERKIADVYDVFDINGNRYVDSREVGTIIRALGLCPTEAEIQEITVSLEDSAKPGLVHLINFLPRIVQLITEHKFQPASADSILEAFRVLDTEGRGFLTKEYITSVMTEYGEPFNEDEIEELLELAIDPHTQTIPYEYYINQLMYEPAPEDDIYLLCEKVLNVEEAPPTRGHSMRRISEATEEMKSRSRMVMSRSVTQQKSVEQTAEEQPPMEPQATEEAAKEQPPE